VFVVSTIIKNTISSQTLDNASGDDQEEHDDNREHYTRVVHL